MMGTNATIRGRRPHVSFVLATHNRCGVVVNTLARVGKCGLDRSDFEIIVVDNASTDGTPDAVAPHVDVLLRRRRNAGSCAKAFGVDRAGGRYIVFLDDDSFPRPGSVVRMIEHFEADPKLGGAGFTIHLPDGQKEGGALPGVFVGCGVGFRAEALRAAGGIDRTFFMQAEEYDLSFRLVAAGWTIKVFDDLHVDHLKTTRARKSSRTTFYDIRNNLRVVARFLPPPYYQVYRADWLQRYAWLAELHHHERAFARGARAGRYRGTIERWAYRGRRLGPDALECFFCWDFVRRRMVGVFDSGVRRIVLGDLGKNIYAFHRGAYEAGLEVLAIADDRFAAPRRRYRGTLVRSLGEALQLGPDAIVVGNTGTVHAARTRDRLNARCGAAVYSWFDEPDKAGHAQFRSQDAARLADEHSMRPCAIARHASESRP